jgi:hypothetical protein
MPMTMTDSVAASGFAVNRQFPIGHLDEFRELFDRLRRIPAKNIVLRPRRFNFPNEVE